MSPFRILLSLGLCLALSGQVLAAASATPEPTVAPVKKPGFFKRLFGGQPKVQPTPAPIVRAVPAPRKAVPAGPSQVAKAPPTVEARDHNVRLQVFLDRELFAPGKISGVWDVFARRAWVRYEAAHGLTATDPTLNPPATIANLGPTYVAYTVTPADAALIGELAGGLAEQAKGKKMPYTTVGEMVTERYHVAPELLRAINPGVNTMKLKAGDTLNVPNVVPFDFAGMIQQRAQLAAARAERAKQIQLASIANPPTPVASVTPPPGPQPPPAVDANRYNLKVLTGEKVLEIREGEKLVACFPITPGSPTLPTPKGNWVVRAKVFLPEFRHDNAMLNTGKRSDDFHMLPPGPNNPVGIMWMGLSKDGIGIHGTPNPMTIGRVAGSHGCVRLANWDAARVANFVEKGTRVTVE